MKNKILTIFVALVMMLEMSAAVTYAEELSESTASETVVNTEYTGNVKELPEYPLLNALGIITGEFKEFNHEFVTRAEAAVCLARMYNKEIDLNASAEYVDVEAYRDDSPYIDFAQKKGLFTKMDRRRFRPDEPITRDELSIMLGRILGYGYVYDNAVGYPNIYYEQAEQSKLFKGTSAGDRIIPEEFVKVLVNTLNAEVCIPKIVGNETGIETGSNLMRENFDVIKAKGVVTGYGFINLAGNDEIGTGKIAVLRESYNIDIEQDKDYTDFIGHTVNYFIDSSDDNERKIILLEKTDTSAEVSLFGEDIEVNGTNVIVYYNKDGRKITRRVSSNAVVIYNGKNAGKFTDTILDILSDDESSIKLIDNDGDGSVDYIFIYRYETYVIDSIDTSLERIYLKYDKIIDGNRYISLNGEEDYKTELLINGVATGIERLRVDNVLSCIPTYEGGKLANLRIIVSRRSVTGRIEGVTQDEYIVNGTEYHISDHYRTIAGKYPDAPVIKLGNQGKIFLDAIGNIAYVKLSKDVYYGYMKRLYPKNADDIETEDEDTEYHAEIFNETGVWCEGDLAKNVILDGEKVGRKICADRLRESGKFESQVVRFSINNDKITMIDTLQKGNGDADYDILELKDTYIASLGTDYGNITGRYYRFINQTVFMVLPENKEKKGQYSVVGRYSFAEGSNVYLKVYGIDEFNTVTFCVFDYSDMQSTDTYENYVMVVEKVVQTVNDEDEIINRAYGYYARGGWGSGDMVDAVLDEAEPGVFKNVKAGDVLMFKLDSERKAIKAKAAFTLDEAKTSEPFHKNSTLKDETSFGTILKVDPTRSLLLMDIGGNTTVFWYGAVAAFDIKTGKVVKIKPADLTPGRKVFNWGYWNLPFLTLMYIE